MKNKIVNVVPRKLIVTVQEEVLWHILTTHTHLVPHFSRVFELLCICELHHICSY